MQDIREAVNPQKVTVGIPIYNTEIYEPTYMDVAIHGRLIVNDLEKFKKSSDIIVANRVSEELKVVIGKVYARDLFCEN